MTKLKLLHHLLLIGLLSCDLSAGFNVSLYGGVSNYKNSLRQPHKEKYDKFANYAAWLESLADYLNKFEWDVRNNLVQDTDYVWDFPTQNNTGFGISNPRDYTSCERKINAQLKIWRDNAEASFSKYGFEITEIYRVCFDYNIDRGRHDVIGIIDVAISKGDYSAHIMVPPEDDLNYNFRFNPYDFVRPEPLQEKIANLAKPNLGEVTSFFRNVVEAEAMLAAKADITPSTTKKNGLTLGVSCSYNKSIFPKVSSKYGVYLGIEGFAEINPNEAKAGGYSVKEKSFGIRPFVGLVSKDKWAIYGILGVKCAKRSVKSNEININKGKMAYEIGVGSDYILSDRFSISAKFIKTLKTTVRVQNSRLSSTSTKILVSLNYHFN